MPKARQKSNGSQQHEEEDDHGPTQTQSLTQAEKSLMTLSTADQNRKVDELIRFMLIMDQKKTMIKKIDMNKHVLKEHSKAFPLFMEKAKGKMETVFGIRVEELAEKQKCYILTNLLDNDTEAPHQKWPAEDSARMGLVMFVLSIVFMKGGVIQDTHLYYTLKQLGVDIDQNHETFGDVKKLLTQEFVRQGYLEYLRQPQSDPPAYDYKWGPRAKLETSKRNVLDFVCQVYTDVEPQQWTSQWQDIVDTEGVPEEEEEQEEVDTEDSG